jgi:hypothetical protein
MLKNIRAKLISLVLICVCLRVILWAIEPYFAVIGEVMAMAVVGVLLITIMGVAIFRSTKL